MNAHGELGLATWSAPSMGGTLKVAIQADPEQLDAAAQEARRAAQRVETWAARLTRFSGESDLSRLNQTRAPQVSVRPTLAATLRWAAEAEQRTEGVVRPTLLDERLAAERLDADANVDADRERKWSITPSGRSSVVARSQDARFDLDGLAKGWIADRAADLLARWPSAVVDADGDISINAGPNAEWLVGVADPRDDEATLATLRVRGGSSWSARFGVATSGTSVHRWTRKSGRPAHHLIDPRTGRPAETDVIQATVVAPTAREAEVIAKSAVILGSDEALPFLERSAALAAILLLESGQVACLPGIEAWLA